MTPDRAGWTVVPGEPGSRVVLHVPHGSTAVPDDVRSQLLLSDDELAAELQAMTDSGTRELAEAAAAGAACRPWTFRNELSRLVVDPERFPDDREVMRQVGGAPARGRASGRHALLDRAGARAGVAERPGPPDRGEHAAAQLRART